ncbi:ATP-binding cassette domain-containing protein [Aristophania vespae]|uniref:ATP-binding cassette domain-containing protein n=1 Tax=Aristophania vespae TaxID=2697033 RepID=A0A6P1NJ68_9PROT|nr:ATP-binding cassette domain-containing protein [Aristophania vespae]QHI95712.1 ATP-binding cassette domain-containing protein [Aristophania vespae]
MSQSAILRLSLRDLWQHLKPVKLMPDVIRLLIAFFLLLVESGTSVATPWLFSKMVGQLSGSERVLAAFMALIAQYGLISLISGIAGPLRDIIIAPLRVWLKRRVALLGLEQIHKQSARFHVNRQTGALTRIIDRGVDAISTILDLLLSNVLPNVFSLVLTFIVILKVYNIAYIFLLSFTLCLYAFISYIFTKKRMKARRERNRLNGEAHHHLVDSLLNADMVRVFGNQDYELQRHDTVRRELQKAELKLQYLVSFSQVTRNVLIAITTIALLGWAGWDIYDQTLEVAQFVLIGTYLRSVYAAVGSLNYVGAGWRNARVDLENYLELMALEPEIKEAPSAKRLPTSFKKAGGVSIICQNVSFGYSDEKKILKNISFEIPAGKIVAVVGQTGSGKSTLSRLLSRAYDPIEGTIFIDNIDCREIALENLHQITGIVPQDTPLFNTTIGENIAYGRVGSDFVHVKEAAQKAHIDQFIDSLPEGYDTIVGERGVKLSGGEKQRVAIARVILKDPRFLILDEASSALDTKTELAIQKELRALSQSRTTFIIAHRLSTIQEADKIIVLDHGEIKEQGTHDELLKKNGYYSALWAAQSGQDTNHF